MTEQYNPFDSVDVNPFASSSTSQPAPDYNPFADTPAQPPAQPASQPPPAQPPSQRSNASATRPPQRSQTVAVSNQQPATPQELSLAERESRLREKEAELAMREQELREAQSSGRYQPPNNWPKCRPFLRHNIAEDIKEAVCRTFTRMGYLFWMYHCGMLLLNAICCAALFAAPGSSVLPWAGTNFGISVVFLALSVPLSWIFWYRPLYMAAKDEKTFKFIQFFVFFAVNLAFVIILMIGPNGAGSCGFINMIAAFQLETAVGIMCILGVLSMAGNVVWSVLILKKVGAHFRGRRRSPLANAAAITAAASAINQA